MKLLDTVLLSLSVAFFIIGVHQTMVGGESVAQGVANAYFFYMVSLLLMFWHRVRRKQQQKEKQEDMRKKQKNTKKRRSK
jgi:predicted Co/Zn/Cd cation transporter (cation efflux family)